MTLKKLVLSLAMTALGVSALQARTINIHGKVTLQGSGEPASGVTIFNADTNRFLGMTGDEGLFIITTDSEGTLLFSGISCQEYREEINGRLEINVAVIPAAIEIQEVIVTAKGNNNALITEPTDLIVEGNTIKLKTKVKIPTQMFSSSDRMIVQPSIYNVTTRHLSFLTPVVFDGRRYASTQKRMYDYDTSLDPLNPYQQIKQTGRKSENTIYLIDSLYIENPRDDFMFVIMSSLENYNRIVYTDTVVTARGTVNPLRFLNYSLDPMAMDEDSFRPTPEVELRDTDGEMHLVFPVGKSELDLSLGNNAEEMGALLNEIKTIENAPDMTLKSFKIFGSSSPEGRYESNLKLAGARMKSAMATVLGSIDSSLKRNAELSSEAEVASWDDVVTMLRADSLMNEADKVQEVIERYAGADARSQAMTRLPFYRPMLTETYLPRLRRVSYKIVSSQYRPLTDAEIAELYVSNPSELSKYQFYRYYTSHQGEEAEQAMRRALETYPDFVVAATDLSYNMLKRKENPIKILEPFFADKTPRQWEKLPVSTRYNMGIACMGDMRYSLADSIIATVPDSEHAHKAKIYCSALNGRYRDVMQEICEDSPLNEVLLLLAVKDNHSAWNRAQKLGNTAVEEYVKAVAANRLDDYLTAITHLENAFSLDPSLKEVAKVDGDLVDLLEEEDLLGDEKSDNTEIENNNE